MSLLANSSSAWDGGVPHGVSAQSFFLPAACLLGLTVIFFTVAAICDDALGPALEGLAQHFRLPHHVASATILALGLALPEISLNALATLSNSDDQIDTAVGAVLGSALLAFTLIPATCVLFSKDFSLALEPGILLRDVAFFCATLILLSLFARNGSFSAKESLLLVLVYFPYLAALLCSKHAPSADDDDGVDGQPFRDEEETELVYGTINSPNFRRASVSSVSSDGEWVPSWFKSLLPPYGMDPAKYFGRVLLVSVVFIAICSKVCLQISVVLANSLGVSHSWAGFVLMGLGAQIEDLLASVYLARTGKATSAMAAIVGSQVLNVCAGVGLPFLLSSVLSGKSVFVHESTKASLVVFAVVLFFTVLCFKSIPSRLVALGLWDVPLLVLAYSVSVWAVFRKV